MKRVLGLAAIVAVMLLAACGDSDSVSTGDGSSDTGDSATSAPPAAGDLPVNILGSWLVDEVVLDGVTSTQPNDDPSVVLIEQGGISGDAGCNRFFGEWSFTAEGGVEIGALAITEMACMGSDDWFDLLDALSAATVVSPDGDVRVLANADGSTSVRLVPEFVAQTNDGDAAIEPDGPDTSTEGTGDEMEITDEPADAADFMGLTEAAAGALAEERGHVWRVAVIDGEPQALTMDFNPDRYNFSVEDGLVTAVSAG